MNNVVELMVGKRRARDPRVSPQPCHVLSWGLVSFVCVFGSPSYEMYHLEQTALF